MISKIENQIHGNEEKKPTLMITMRQVLECHHRLTQQPHFTDQKGKHKEAGPDRVQVQAQWAWGIREPVKMFKTFF